MSPVPKLPFRKAQSKKSGASAKKSTVSAILLAAGESRRMHMLKATLDWRKRPLIIYQLEQLLAIDANEVVVVLGYKSKELASIIKSWGFPKGSVRTVVNEHYREGRTTSIIKGLSALPKSDSIMVFSVDQPRPALILQRLIEAHTKGHITIPAFGEKHGHPPIYDASMHDELLEISEETDGLKSVNKRHEKDIHYVPFDSGEVLINLNRPEDYEKAHAKYGKGLTA